MSQFFVSNILEYIEQHIEERICLNDLAQMAGYSPFYFSTLFSEIMGISVTSYIRIRKLQYALSSLITGEKVVDVAIKYHFESHEGFTRSFVKLFGSPPRTVKKYLKFYEVPQYIIPDMHQMKGQDSMKQEKNLIEDMYKIPNAFLAASLAEWDAGHCTHIKMKLLQDNTIEIIDNGRGIPLDSNLQNAQNLLNKILSGHPVTPFDYAHMEVFPTLSLQAANSLCEKLQLTVYRNGKSFRQDFVRGIAQHDIICEASSHPSGMEVKLKPDTEIFGTLTFDASRVTISKNK